MKALTYGGPGVVRYEDVADPGIAASTDALVRVERSAICGSDLHVWRGDETGLDGGTVLGHEFAGEVLEVGRDVRRLAPGDRVASPFTTSCGACPPCREGLTCRCQRGELFGWVEDGAGLHGAQAELVRVPLADATLVPLPAGVDFEAALLCGDVLSTGLFCAEAADVRPGAVAIVVGCGPVGLMGTVAAQELGAAAVYGVDSVPERLALCAALGGIPLDRGALDPVELVRAATGGRGADCVLEAVGTPGATRLAVELVRAGGTLAACGVHCEASFAFGPGEAYDKNLTYRAGRCPARRYMERSLALVRSGRYDLAALVSHRLPLADGPRAYDVFDRKLEGCTKVVLEPPGRARG